MSTNNFLKGKKKGFTLLEIIISIALIAIFVIPIGNLVLTSVKINKMSEDKQQGQAILQQTVEKLKEEGKLYDGLEIQLQDGMKVKLEAVAGASDKFNVIHIDGIDDYTINGTIEKDSSKSQVYVGINTTKVDSVIYYKNGKMYVDRNEIKIAEAVRNLPSTSFGVTTDVTIELENATIDENIKVNSGSMPFTVAAPNRKILIITDKNNSEKLNVSIKNSTTDKIISVYIYTIGKESETDDVNLKEIGDRVQILTGITNEQMKSEDITYEVELKVSNNGKDIETIKTNIIK